MIIQCPTCGKEFEDYGRKKHCSVACNNRDPINREKSRQRISKLNQTDHFKKMNHDKMVAYNKSDKHKIEARKSIMKYHKYKYDKIHSDQNIILYLIKTDEFIKIGICQNIIGRWGREYPRSVRIEYCELPCNQATELELKVKTELYARHLQNGSEYFDPNMESKIKEILNLDWTDYSI